MIRIDASIHSPLKIFTTRTSPIDTSGAIRLLIRMGNAGAIRTRIAQAIGWSSGVNTRGISAPGAATTARIALHRRGRPGPK